VRVEIESDGLEHDDVRYFVPGEIRRIEVLKGGGVEASKPLGVALELLQVGDAGIEGMKDPRPGDGKTDSVLVAFWSDRDRIREALDRGAGLILFPDRNGATGLRGTRIPVGTVGNVSRSSDTQTGEGARSEKGYQVISTPAGLNIPPFIGELTAGLPMVKVMNYTQLVPSREWEGGKAGCWRLDLEGGDPFLIAGEIGNSRVVVWSVSPDEASSDLFGAPLFLPLFDGLLRYAVGGSGTSEVLCGETIVLRSRPGNAEGAIAVTAPGGGEFLMRPDAAGYFRFRRTDEPGFYAAFEGGKAWMEYAVNVDIRESDMTEIDKEELDLMLAPRPVAVVRRGEQLEENILTRRGGREISTWLLLAVLMMLLAESLISGRIKISTTR
jgi:hypothetical protein